MSAMLYPCMLCLALLMCLFVLCVACLTVFVNCLVKHFAMCLGVVAILLLNVNLLLIIHLLISAKQLFNFKLPPMAVYI